MNQIPENSIKTQEISFYELISDFDIIEIPDIQRDYAYGRGRKNGVDPICEGLISSISNALSNPEEKCMLNFIYGKVEEEEDQLERKIRKFIPIDGQQRLTTLYLLYWFFFKSSGRQSEIEKLRKFVYATRDTSKRFCGRLCDDSLQIEFNHYDKDNEDPKAEPELLKISKQLKNYPWFTRAFETDPTIQSMVAVLDYIQVAFIDSNYSEVSDILCSSNCPVYFLWFGLKKIGNTDDLYIKMNARGRQLSDYEIFKAEFENSALLKRLLKNPTDQERIKYISKLNTEYSDFFYHFLGKTPNDASDYGLFMFIKTYIRDEYFVLLSECDIPQDSYREKFKDVMEMSGRNFCNFICNPDYYGLFAKKGTEEEKYKDVIYYSFLGVNDLLEKFLSFYKENSDLRINKPDDPCFGDYFTPKQFIEDLGPKGNITARDTIRYYALLSLLSKFDFPKTSETVSAYFMWLRFVYNLSVNASIKTNETVAEIMLICKTAIKEMDSYTEEGVLRGIVAAGDNSTLKRKSYAMSLLDEEVLKAKLILQDNRWENSILAAEGYFNNSEIKFLLYFSKSEGKYSLDSFDKYFGMAQNLWESDKKLSVGEGLDIDLFERGMLCLEDNSSTGTAHLVPNSKGCFAFCYDDFSDIFRRPFDMKDSTLDEHEKKLGIVKSYIDMLFDKDADEINRFAESLIDNYDEKESWKYHFIKNKLYNETMESSGPVKFKNNIYKDKAGNILLLSSVSRQSRNMELNTFMLFYKLRELGINTTLHFGKSGEIFAPGEKYPIRYLTYLKSRKSARIYYFPDSHDYLLVIGTEEKHLSFNEAIEAIKAL